jgi:hypothetical protein
MNHVRPNGGGDASRATERGWSRMMSEMAINRRAGSVARSAAVPSWDIRGMTHVAALDASAQTVTVERPREGVLSGVAGYAAMTVAVVIFWSLTYLMRQSGVAVAAEQPFSLIGNFALEGAMLALAWLGLVVVACAAVLRGHIVIASDR